MPIMRGTSDGVACCKAAIEGHHLTGEGGYQLPTLSTPNKGATKMNVASKIEAFASVADAMTDEELGKIFRVLIRESQEEKRRISETRRKSVSTRYKKLQTPTSDVQNPTKNDFVDVCSACSPSPTPLSSDDMCFNNNINIYNQSFDASTDTEVDTSGTSPRTTDTSPRTTSDTSSNKFQKPTLEEVKSYVAEKGYSVNPEKFFAYYEAGGWMVGKRPMRSWRMALTYWHNNGIDRSQHPPNSTSKRVAEQNYTQREYTDEQLDSLIADI